MIEEWKPSAVVGFSVSNLGRIRNDRIRRPTRGTKDHKGYLRLRIYGLGNIRIHRLVASAFLGEPPHNLYTVDHIDANKTNNRADNL